MRVALRWQTGQLGTIQIVGAVMNLRHILAVAALITAGILFFANMPSGAFVALLVGTAVELVGAALTGKKKNT